MERLITETASEREETIPLEEGVDPIAKKHRDAIRNGAEEDSNE